MKRDSLARRGGGMSSSSSRPSLKSGTKSSQPLWSAKISHDPVAASSVSRPRGGGGLWHGTVSACLTSIAAGICACSAAEAAMGDAAGMSSSCAVLVATGMRLSSPSCGGVVEGTGKTPFGGSGSGNS